jgi:hypothetical protein
MFARKRAIVNDTIIETMRIGIISIYKAQVQTRTKTVTTPPAALPTQWQTFFWLWWCVNLEMGSSTRKKKEKKEDFQVSVLCPVPKLC